MSNRINNVFLKDSNIDAFNYYNLLLQDDSSVFWDIIVITASNEQQAMTYRDQIDFRLANNMLPKSTEYIVISDPDGKRIGSGGATFNVLRYIVDMYDDINIFSHKRIMIIHSGGDSKRIPQYSACGKLFSPTPREIKDSRPSTLFDELIISFSNLPSRMQNGILVLSGDALLLFNTLQIDFQYKKVAALSIKADIETGTHHGVFLSGSRNEVRLFLHKANKEELIETGAAKNGYVDIDSGAIFMDSDVVNSVLSLITDNGKIDNKKIDMFVNEDVQLNFYGDFLYPMASAATYEQYLGEKAEKDISPKLLECRKEIWGVLNKYRINIIKLFPSKFIHFGTTNEFLDMITKSFDNYKFIGWEKSTFSINNSEYSPALISSIVCESCTIGSNSYIENSIIYDDVLIGSNVIVSNAILTNVIIPDNMCLSTLKLDNRKYITRIYGILDNPKDVFNDNLVYMSHNLNSCFEYYHINVKEIWDNNDLSMWHAKLYVPAQTVEDSARTSLLIYDILSCKASKKQVSAWLKSERYSLFSSFNKCDNKAMLEEKKSLENKIRIEKIIKSLNKKEDINISLGLLENSINVNEIVDFFLKNINLYSYSVKMRIYLLLSMLSRKNPTFCDVPSDILLNKVFETIKDYTNEELTLNTKKNVNIAKKEASVELPIRVNFGGGWSDTPPYCLENGGTVLNAAFSLQNKLPIRVVVKKIKELEIVLESIDYGAKITINNINDILNCSNPYDPFVLFKASLITSGIVPYINDIDLEAYLKSIGGGLHLISDVTEVPRGSGLGTSSILIGACLKSLHELMGEDISDDIICKEVLMAEQLMSTGGGWQDQVGGIISGIKLVTTKPGTNQTFNVKKLDICQNIKSELDERIVLIYTGQRRLARNLLREIVLKYISFNKDIMEIINRIQKTAILMAFELEKGNIDEFARLMNEQWDLSILLDKGSSNICIEQIINLCSDLIDGKIIVGAGGGGFIVVLLKKGISKQILSGRLQEGFQDSGVELYDSKIIY